MIIPFQALACPLDGAPLQRHGQAWRCPAGHSFDVAAQGHIHLLPVQQKRSRDPGDSKEMVAARRRFLEAGHYLPIAHAVGRTVLDGLASNGPVACLDAGCGEGYYLRQLAEMAEKEGKAEVAAGRGEGRGRRALDFALLGLDISKWAVLAAARRDTRVAWVVGSNANLPVLPATLDRLLCMFGFPVYAEFARVLKPGGELLQVDAGPDHLRELREVIYPTLKPPRLPDERDPEGFQRLSSDTLRYTATVDGAGHIADLLAMTPHLFRASAEGRARAAALHTLSITVDVRLTRFARR